MTFSLIKCIFASLSINKIFADLSTGCLQMSTLNKIIVCSSYVLIRYLQVSSMAMRSCIATDTMDWKILLVTVAILHAMSVVDWSARLYVNVCVVSCHFQ